MGIQKAVTAMIMGGLAILANWLALPEWLNEQYVTTFVAALTPVLVWLVPNRGGGNALSGGKYFSSVIVAIFAMLLMVSCATTLRGKLNQADESVTALITLSAVMIEQGVIPLDQKPRVRACLKTLEDGFNESRTQLLAGNESGARDIYDLTLKALASADAFIKRQEGNLDECLRTS